MKTPTCTSKRHSWQPIGGCRENPGYVGLGGTALSYTERCRHCGLQRRRVVGDLNPSGTLNHRWRYAPAKTSVATPL